jgi:hypothetical protein
MMATTKEALMDGRHGLFKMGYSGIIEGPDEI